MRRRWSNTSRSGGGGSSGKFSCPTLKDLEALLHDDLADSPCRVLHRARPAVRAIRSIPSSSSFSADPLDRRRRRIVLYFTSLGVVRRTFDDCRAVRSALRSLRVAVDERDVSVDARFRAELQAAFGRRFRQQHVALPQVFLSGRCLGGADEIRRLHESGELRALVEGIPSAPTAPCGVCGGVRFVLCATCSGSRKRWWWGSKGGGFRACGECNENGLVRCPDCFPAAV
ncbi:uncharacterized protein At5g39865-like [Zingiber officinale]|uniref:Glutaredoxin domain-containing protein n=1 Tax=Zingiber officinale TaxID=94328 RepID=A0A8J5F444_ZINOF|nr:uncharacterized protein At5g39865-like [Zingiber officinale]KAG6477818.1 hypothetical protein ZIOFF_061250 [Zingiber officinale]